MKFRSLVWSATLFLLLVTYLPAMAQDNAAAEQRTQSRIHGANVKTSNAPAAAAPAAPVAVVGGPVKQILSVSNSASSITTSTAFVALAGATRVVNVPAGGDTVLITFTAECELLPSDNDGNEWVGVEIRDGATVIGGGADASFCGGQDYGMNSIQVVKRLAQGTHTIRVYFKTTDAAREAWLDDWTLTILQSE